MMLPSLWIIRLPVYLMIKNVIILHLAGWNLQLCPCCGWNPFIFLVGLIAITSSNSHFIQISSFTASEFWIWMPSLPYCFPDSAVFPYALMFHCHWRQSEPIHLHWPVFCCILPSPGPHEDCSCSVPWVSLLWQGGSESSGGSWDGPCCSWNDMVRECIG